MRVEAFQKIGQAFLSADDKNPARHKAIGNRRKGRFYDFIPVVCEEIVPEKDDLEVPGGRSIGGEVMNPPPDAFPDFVGYATL